MFAIISRIRNHAEIFKDVLKIPSNIHQRFRDIYTKQHQSSNNTHTKQTLLSSLTLYIIKAYSERKLQAKYRKLIFEKKTQKEKPNKEKNGLCEIKERV